MIIKWVRVNAPIHRSDHSLLENLWYCLKIKEHDTKHVQRGANHTGRMGQNHK